MLARLPLADLESSFLISAILILVLGCVFESHGFSTSSYGYLILTGVTAIVIVGSALVFFFLLAFELYRSLTVSVLNDVAREVELTRVERSFSLRSTPTRTLSRFSHSSRSATAKSLATLTGSSGSVGGSGAPRRGSWFGLRRGSASAMPPMGGPFAGPGDDPGLGIVDPDATGGHARTASGAHVPEPSSDTGTQVARRTVPWSGVEAAGDGGGTSVTAGCGEVCVSGGTSSSAATSSDAGDNSSSSAGRWAGPWSSGSPRRPGRVLGSGRQHQTSHAAFGAVVTGTMTRDLRAGRLQRRQPGSPGRLGTVGTTNGAVRKDTPDGMVHVVVNPLIVGAAREHATSPLPNVTVDDSDLVHVVVNPLAFSVDSVVEPPRHAS